jgi:hypothetical protein
MGSVTKLFAHEALTAHTPVRVSNVRIGQIIVRDVSEASLRAGFPDCDIAVVGPDLQITFELRDLAETYPLLDRVRQMGASLVRLSITESPSSD